jgi:hypothetical protein
MIHKNLLRAFATLIALLAVLVLAMMLGACSPSPLVNADGADEVGAMIRAGGLRYASDPNTGDCFAYAFIVRPGQMDNRASVGGAVITWVPCSAERP